MNYGTNLKERQRIILEAEKTLYKGKKLTDLAYWELLEAVLFFRNGLKEELYLQTRELA